MESMPRSRTLGALTEELAQRVPDVEAIAFEGQRLTYAELGERVRAVAKGLLALGVSPGENVACWLPNRPEWVVANLAISSIGAVTVGMNTWYRSHELEYTLDHAGVSVLIMTDRFLKNDYVETLASVASEMLAPRDTEGAVRFPQLRQVVMIEGSERVPSAISWTQLVEAGRTLGDERLDQAIAAVRPEDAADLLYTSGSTTTPKGVVLLHDGLIENGFNIGARQRVVVGDRLWLANPLFFSYGCANALMVTLTHACTLVLQDVFEAGRALRCLESERCTVLYGTTNMALAMTSHPDRASFDTSSLRTGTAMGSPAQVQLRIDLGAAEICNIYGLTETYGNCCVTDAHDPLDMRLNSQGAPLTGNELRIVGPDTGELLPSGEVGEIRVRGYVLPGYFKDPERTADAFDADGFFRTGDLGFLDTDGRIHWVGRETEMLKTGGINVAPVEVEEVLLQHPAVEDVVVVGLPDELQDEIVAAFVSRKPGSSLTAEDLSGFCRERLANYKVPRKVVFLAREDFPLTATGKVWRKRLREQFLEDAQTPGSPAGTGSQRDGVR